jgi:ATP-binding cassette, subfamily B, bacterial PglK
MLVVFALVAAVLETVGTGAVFGLISVVADPTSLGRVPVIGAMLADWAGRDPVGTILGVGLAVGIFFIAKGGFLLFQIHNQEKTAFTTTDWVVTTLMRGYMHAPYSFHFQRNSAQLIRALEFSGDDAIRGGLQSAATVISEAFIVLGLISVLLVSEPLISAVTALFLGGLMLVTYRSTRRIFSEVGNKVLSSGVQVVQAVQQGLGAVKEVKVLGREDHFADVFAALRHERSHNQRVAAVVGQMPRLATETLMVVAMILIVALVVMGGGDRAAVLPTLGLFGYAGFRLQPSLNRLVLYLNSIVRTGASVDLLIRDWPVVHAAANRPLTHPAPLPFTDRLTLENIQYAYPAGDRLVLDGISLTIERGRSIGIVGSTGAGKSTLIDIILGLLPPTSGRVLVDGVDIAADPRAWQRRIGYVPQTIYLTDDTLRRNIAFGLADAEIDETQLREALEMAQLAEFMDSLPQGLDTRVGERGLNLSGGQRQRVGIARALYHRPELLIFDEATSALDGETEREVSRAIDRLAGQMSLILIAHRLSTLHHCDQLFMVKQGRIAAQGTFQELIETNDDFRKMASLANHGGERYREEANGTGN